MATKLGGYNGKILKIDLVPSDNYLDKVFITSFNFKAESFAFSK
mgnify:CR=1 FL=1